MYTPAFLEIFVGFVLVLRWARWLRDRPVPLAVVNALPWVAGAAVIVGQLFALWGLLQATGGEPAEMPVRLGRWGSFGVVIGCLVVELGITAWGVLAKKPGPTT